MNVYLLEGICSINDCVEIKFSSVVVSVGETSTKWKESNGINLLEPTLNLVDKPLFVILLIRPIKSSCMLQILAIAILSKSNMS